MKKKNYFFSLLFVKDQHLNLIPNMARSKSPARSRTPSKTSAGKKRTHSPKKSSGKRKRYSCLNKKRVHGNCKKSRQAKQAKQAAGSK